MFDDKKPPFEDDTIIDLDKKKDLQNMFNKGKNFFGLIFIILVLIIAGMSSVYKLDEGTAGVVLRFEKVIDVEQNAGLHFKVPFIDTVEFVDVSQVYKMEYGYATSKEGTENSQPIYEEATEEATVIVDASQNNASIALINIMVQYKIDDPQGYLFNVDDVEGTMRLALEDVLRSTIQSYTLDQARTQKEVIDAEILPALQSKLDLYNSGIKIIKVQTQNTLLLPAVQEAYQQKENANQYKNGKVEEAEKYRNTVIPQAEAEAMKLIEEANGYQAEVIANSRAAVAEFDALYEEYKKNPDIVKEKYFVESMREFITNNKIIIDTTDGGDIYKFFNLDENQNAIKQEITQGEE